MERHTTTVPLTASVRRFKAAGCALSHFLAYKRIIDLDLPLGFVAEDDILSFSTRDFASVLRHVGSPTGDPADPVSGWDVVQLQTCPTGQVRELASYAKPPMLFNGSAYCAGMCVRAGHTHTLPVPEPRGRAQCACSGRHRSSAALARARIDAAEAPRLAPRELG